MLMFSKFYFLGLFVFWFVRRVLVFLAVIQRTENELWGKAEFHTTLNYANTVATKILRELCVVLHYHQHNE